MVHAFNGSYDGDNLSQIAFPLGGIGAGMICLEGSGSFSHVSLRHQPDTGHEPLLFASVGFPSRPDLARVIESQTPS